MSSRRHSLSNSAKKIYIDKNSISEATEIRVENTADARQITADELEDVILGPMRFTDDNAERLNMLEYLKEPYLFSSDDLIKMTEITPSLKTRIEMINMVGPRLTDPNAKVAVFTGMFRFSEEKHTVEEVLKARMNAINASKFTNKTGTSALKGGGGRGGAGRGVKMAPASAGRGGGGRGPVPAPGRGSSRVTSLPAHLPSSGSPHSPKMSASPKAPITSPITLSGRALPPTPGQESVLTPQATPSATSARPFSTTADEFSKLQQQPHSQKQPEICPEDGVVNGSPVSLAETDSETVDTRESVPAIPKTSATHPVPIDHSRSNAHRALPALPFDSPHTDGEGFTPTACNTPVDVRPNKTEAERRPSATLATTLFASVTEDTLPTPPSTTGESARTTPVPGASLIEITARAPQRGPPAQSRRTGASAGVSPVPPTAGAQKSPTLTPSTSSASLSTMGAGNPTAAQLALGGTATSTAAAVPSSAAAKSAATPAIVVAPPTAHGSYASQSGTYDLAPMVADCKPEVGVHSLLSKFSGTGGTRSAAAPPPRSAPSDCTPAKTRNIADLTNAFAMKPATSTASSTLNQGYSFQRNTSFRSGTGISAAEARSQAPAPIVIPGATVSLAEMRAKFSGGSGSSSSSSSSSTTSAPTATSGVMSAVSSPNRLVRTESGSASAPASDRIPLRRRHSESLGSINLSNSAFAAAVAAVNAPSAAAEVAGAGADLATRCATALHLSKTEFLALTAEDAVFVPEVVSETALPQYTYREVVRRNFHKEYEGMNQSVLELYVCDEDFFSVFLRSKAEYLRQPRWRQVEQKKKAMLF